MLNGDEYGHFFFGFGSSKKYSKERTKTFIWGNGLYQITTGLVANYINFEPKYIKNFNGEISPFMKKIQFGKGFTAAIDVNGDVHVWKQEPLHSIKKEGVNYNIKNDVVTLDKDGKTLQLAFTKKFLWLLKEDGTVHQFKVLGDVDQDSLRVSNPQIITKKRKIESLKNIKMISSGVDHFVALDNEGKIYTMGDDTLGQCGLGSFERNTGGPYYERRVRKPEVLESKISEIKLTPIDLPKMTKIVCGSHHTLAISDDGSAYGWGSNSHMQISQELEYSRADNPFLVSFRPIKIERGKFLSYWLLFIIEFTS